MKLIPALTGCTKHDGGWSGVFFALIRQVMAVKLVRSRQKAYSVSVLFIGRGLLNFNGVFCAKLPFKRSW
ncbi:homoserine acetyltransferase [Acetobacter orientalis]|uniref:Homoserine acetyltransferase n=1 Tax=Acetobacter orientalis TaxID=146474 RepID=A0A2Z5ZIF2_9PROT|nr:homoserine acetyltransferase [Acetobacter orientalis]